MHQWYECRLVQPLWKAVRRYLKKLKMKLLCDPAIPLLGTYLKKPKTLIQKNISTPIFIAVVFTITKIWKQPKCPSVDECIKQLWDIYTMEHKSAIKMKEIFVLDFTYLFVEREEGKKKERERNINVWLPLTQPRHVP